MPKRLLVLWGVSILAPMTLLELMKTESLAVILWVFPHENPLVAVRWTGTVMRCVCSCKDESFEFIIFFIKLS
jgi:hypothetical protein